MWLDLEIMDLGFTEDDIEKIRNNFEYTPKLEDWEEMILFKSDEEIFKYLYIEDQSKESIVEILLEMGEVSAEDLEDGQTVINYMVDDDSDEFILKLSNGRWVVFSDELLGKEARQQMD
ncbi:hypothetical protein [Bacillus wiedmannii]|uniref:hypothetical protein n=1 Tax=Bacillus wiedmannii TaxID=1890302 RepID=UPI000BFD8C6C|nr:hypothetical protein [Bacillus wiedmannii]PHE68529.1 hypothetical protein COF77_29155 [Bacillus wiedmannii]